ncbi:hypothetical protein BV25DRAFT_1821234 [Artomyces pyxidatus]|uniref:Uncharacterized protein n=1 Tax=Artomyces pyxidatus TaxID=48021 RepID=A0ACB8TCG6_9AGAM|nr:hypothetical protein BV25DRAFT_1821234 [Artomyces pyxidatus]
MSLSKIGPLLLSAVLVWKAFTPPPSSQTSPTEKVELQHSGIERGVTSSFVHYHMLVNKIQYCIVCLCEVVWTVASSFSHHPVVAALSYNDDPSSAVRVTPQFIAGMALIVGGALLRFACFDVMGKHFTFKVLLREEHRLITAGPYSYVRHPSYTGLYALFVGCALVLYGDGSWFRESGWLESQLGRAWVTVWVLMRLFESVMIGVRTVTEDGFLREKFGDEWAKWAARTQYRLVPFIF